MLPLRNYREAMSLIGIAWPQEKVKGGLPGELLAIELMVVLLVVVSYDKSKNL